MSGFVTFIIVTAGVGVAVLVGLRYLPVTDSWAAGYVQRAHLQAWRDLESLLIGLLILLGVVLAGCGLIAVVIYPSRAVGRTTCRHFAEQSGYPTKFTILNWADTGTCLARTPDGHWTKNTNIIVNVPAKP